jgi:hypothetical protein
MKIPPLFACQGAVAPRVRPLVFLRRAAQYRRLAAYQSITLSTIIFCSVAVFRK